MITIRQRNALAACKVAIGARYTGPALDRPALRQMPREWRLSTEPSLQEKFVGVVRRVLGVV
jgi:hypothetical protein